MRGAVRRGWRSPAHRPFPPVPESGWGTDRSTRRPTRLRRRRDPVPVGFVRLSRSLYRRPRLRRQCHRRRLPPAARPDTARRPAGDTRALQFWGLKPAWATRPAAVSCQAGLARPSVNGRPLRDADRPNPVGAGVWSVQAASSATPATMADMLESLHMVILLIVW